MKYHVIILVENEQIPLLERPKPVPAKRAIAIKPETSKRAKVASSPAPQGKSLSGIVKSKKKKVANIYEEVADLPETLLDNSLSGMVFKEDPGLLPSTEVITNSFTQGICSCGVLRHIL